MTKQTIQSVREELEKAIVELNKGIKIINKVKQRKPWDYRKEYNSKPKNWNEIYNLGKKEGVSLAQKEFLDFLIGYKNLMLEHDLFASGIYGNDNFNINKMIIKLEKSLSEDKS